MSGITLRDEAKRFSTPPLQGRGKGWGVNAERLEQLTRAPAQCCWDQLGGERGMRADFNWPSTKAELADLVESMMGWTEFDKKFEWDVDEFENVPLKDPALEAWRQRIMGEIWHLQFPSRGEYEDGIAEDRARQIVASLRNNEDA